MKRDEEREREIGRERRRWERLRCIGVMKGLERDEEREIGDMLELCRGLMRWISGRKREVI